jgi:antirestriction protein ArdC
MVNGKAADTVQQTLGKLVALFESGKLPEAIAKTVIRRAAGDAPCCGWSLGNQLILLAEGTADARGYKQWLEAGRQVRKGAKAIYILRPQTKKRVKVVEVDGHEEEREVSFVVGFRGIPVFKIEDTEGPEIPEANYAPPEFPPLWEVAERFEVAVQYAPFLADYRGAYSPGRKQIVLCTHDARTYFHELGHAAHDRILGTEGRKLRGGQVAAQEVIAETTAAVLSLLYGFEGYLQHSHEYIKHYAQDGNAGQAVMQVAGDVDKVLRAILGEAAVLPASLRNVAD